MNYKERIQYPEFLQEKEREGRSKTDPFWILHEKYLKCDYGEKNFKHTWNKGE